MDKKEWKLGNDLSTYDNLLDGITFDDLILAVCCNCKTIDPAAVMREFRELLNGRLDDMYFLLENNVPEIMEEARKRRSHAEEGCVALQM